MMESTRRKGRSTQTMCTCDESVEAASHALGRAEVEAVEPLWVVTSPKNTVGRSIMAAARSMTARTGV